MSTNLNVGKTFILTLYFEWLIPMEIEMVINQIEHNLKAK